VSVGDDGGRGLLCQLHRRRSGWAEWIAEQLEAAGYTTLLQPWDFRPGGDFLRQMQHATSSAQRTVAVLSPAYFGSRFGEAEWRAAFAKDPTGELPDSYPITGKRRQQTRGRFKTKRECQAGLHDALAALRAGTFVEPSKRTPESFLADEWLPALRHLRPSTLSNYRTHIRTSVLPMLGPIPLQQLSPAHLNAFYQALLSRGRLRDGRGMAPKTVQNVHAILHRVLKDAMRWGYTARNVADAVDPPRGLPAERQGLDARAAPRLPQQRAQRPPVRRVAARGHHRVTAR
jgi:TIR domain/Phage integrase, N-terminal SAM-like domain